jgi:hypothetical protein
LVKKESMTTEELEKMKAAADLAEMRKALHAMCRPLGGIHTCALSHESGNYLVRCYVTLSDQKNHPQLVRTTGGYMHGREVCFDVPVAPGFAPGRG